MSIFKTLPNVDSTIIKLLKLLSVDIDETEVIDELEKHPDYPGLLAISDVLTNFKIENSAFYLNSEELVNLTCPFIAHTYLKGGDFVVVNKITPNSAIVSNDQWTNHKVDIDDFKKLYTGTVLVINLPVPSRPSISLHNILGALRPPVLVLAFLFVLFSAIFLHSDFLSNLSWQLISLAVLKTAGLFISVLLLLQSLDNNNPFVRLLCQRRAKVDCNAILSSKAAKVFYGLTWSEVGFFYFAGTWLALFFLSGSVAALQLLALLNFVSLPFTAYSVYYQWRVARQWCMLCCIVQALLWIEFIPLFLIFHIPLQILANHNHEWNNLFMALLIPVIIWSIIKPLLFELKQLSSKKGQLRKFKYSIDQFNQLLTGQKRFAQPDVECCILLGKPDANNIITMVSNPYCPPCSQTHKLLDSLLERHDNLQARIVFVSDNADKPVKTTIGRHLVALNEVQDQSILKNALNDWYSQKQKNYETWAKLYPVTFNGIEDYKMEKQNAWCQSADMSATPTILLNGYLLPEMYLLSDLKYLLE